MSLGKIVIFTVGAAAGVMLGLAATKSETVRNAGKATIKAGLRAKDWTADKYEKAKGELTSLVKEAHTETEEPA